MYLAQKSERMLDGEKKVLFRHMLDGLPRRSANHAGKFSRCLLANKFPTTSAYDAPLLRGTLTMSIATWVSMIERLSPQFIPEAFQLGHYTQPMADNV